MKIIPYGRHEILEEDIEAVAKVLRSDFLTQGPTVSEFEEGFAKYVGSKYAVAVNSGTAALHISVLALSGEKNPHVVTTPNSFVATSNSVLYAGGQISFVDIDLATATIDLNCLEDFLKKNKRVDGVIPVDFAGYPVDLKALRLLSEQYGFWILEDACHAPGGYRDYGNERVYCGSNRYSDVAIFSFHPVKHIATGEGGMVTTNDRKLYEKLLRFRSHGITKRPEEFIGSRLTYAGDYPEHFYEMQELGFNYRMPDILAALGLSQLGRAKQNLEKRKRIALEYDSFFKKYPAVETLTTISTDIGHAHHLFTIRNEFRDQIYRELKKKGIICQVHYIPIFTNPYYCRFGYSEKDFPNSIQNYKFTLSLPIFPSLTKRNLEFITECLTETLGYIKSEKD